MKTTILWFQFLTIYKRPGRGKVSLTGISGKQILTCLLAMLVKLRRRNEGFTRVIIGSFWCKQP